MQKNTVLVLFDLGYHFEEGQDQRRGLSVGQRGMLKGVCAQSVMQDIGRAGQEEPQTVGEERRRRRAVAMEMGIFAYLPEKVYFRILGLSSEALSGLRLGLIPESGISSFLGNCHEMCTDSEHRRLTLHRSYCIEKSLTTPLVMPLVLKVL